MLTSNSFSQALHAEGPCEVTRIIYDRNDTTPGFENYCSLKDYSFRGRFESNLETLAWSGCEH